MKAFEHFAERNFKLFHWASLQKDGRGSKVEIPTSTLFRALIYQPALGYRSQLNMDEWLRTQHARDALGSSRPMVASDTTLNRSLEHWNLDVLRLTLRSATLRMRMEGRLKLHLSAGRVFRPCVVDGSAFGGHWASALVLIGSEMTCGMDVEPYEKRGKERAASRKMMDRAIGNLGKGFASHLLYDGLLACRRDFSRFLYDGGMHLVVKTTDERLHPIQWAKELFSKSRRKADREELHIHVTTGVDADRNIEFEVWSVSNVKWSGLAPLLNVARVSETHLKGKFANKPEVFWVLTTDLTLLPSELRELAHLRWRIENNQFKELNDLVGSKRAYIKNPAVKLALLLIWFLGWTIFQAFRLLDAIRRRLAGLKTTKRFLQMLILFGEISLLFDSS